MSKLFSIAIFASGTGTNAVNIIKYFNLHPQIQVVCVCYNRKNAGVKLAAENLGIDTQYVSKNWFVDSSVWLKYLESKKANCIILAGFLKMVPQPILNKYNDFILNIHPALLPNYGGKGMFGMHVHEAVIKNSEKETGITIHKVNERYDEGEIVFQKSVKIDSNDDAVSVSEKIRKTEHAYFPKVIEAYLLKNPMPEL